MEVNGRVRQEFAPFLGAVIIIHSEHAMIEMGEDRPGGRVR